MMSCQNIFLEGYTCYRKIVKNVGQAKGYLQIVQEFECKYLRKMLRETNGNVSQAAEIAGKERRAFGKLLIKNHIDRKEFSTLR